MEDSRCWCGRTPLEVGKEFVSSEDKGRTELSYVSARVSEYIAPPVENPVPLPVPPPFHLVAPLPLLLYWRKLLKNMPEPSAKISTVCCKRQMQRELEIFKKGLQTRWYVLHLELAQINGGGSTEFIGCVQGQAEGLNKRHALIPISERIPADILSSSGVRENQGEEQVPHLALPWEIFFPMFPEELRRFLLSTLMGMDLQLQEKNLSGRLVESWVSGFMIVLKIKLTDAEGEELMAVMGVDEMERIQGGD